MTTPAKPLEPIVLQVSLPAEMVAPQAVATDGTKAVRRKMFTHGAFGIGRRYDTIGDVWVVTHLPTGRAAFCCNGLHTALMALGYLAGVAVDWAKVTVGKDETDDLAAYMVGKRALVDAFRRYGMATEKGEIQL